MKKLLGLLFISVPTFTFPYSDNENQNSNIEIIQQEQIIGKTEDVSVEQFEKLSQTKSGTILERLKNGLKELLKEQQKLTSSMTTLNLNWTN